MPLIAPTVVRFTVHGSIGPDLTANVLDVSLTDVSSTRAAACELMAGRILDSWDTNYLPLMSSTWSAQRVSWLDLDSALGSTGDVSATAGNTWPQAGSQAGAAFPNNVAQLQTKVITGGRGIRNGRLYIPGQLEANTDVGAINSLNSAAVTAWNTAADALFVTLNANQATFDPEFVVVHTLLPRDAGGDVIPGGEPIYNGFSQVQDLRVESRLATQRQRLRR